MTLFSESLVKPPYTSFPPRSGWEWVLDGLKFWAPFDDDFEGGLDTPGSSGARALDVIGGERATVGAGQMALEPGYFQSEIGPVWTQFNTVSGVALPGQTSWANTLENFDFSSTQEFTVAWVFKDLKGAGTTATRFWHNIGILDFNRGAPTFGPTIFLRYGFSSVFWDFLPDFGLAHEAFVVTWKNGVAELFCRGRSFGTKAFGITWNNTTGSFFLGNGVKANVSFNGHFGCMLTGNRAWAPEEAMAWSEQPFEWITPRRDLAILGEPILTGCPTGDLTVGLATSGRVVTGLATSGELQTGLATSGRINVCKDT